MQKELTNEKMAVKKGTENVMLLVYVQNLSLFLLVYT